MSDTSDPASRDANEKSIIVITSLAHMICHIGELLFTGVLTAVMVEFVLEKYEVTALPVLGFILMGAGALPVGIWADTWGTRRVLQVYLFAMALGCLAVVLAPTVWLLFAALTVLGLATSIYHPAGVAMLSLGVRARGRAMGINGVAGSIGVATGPLLGILAAHLGVWRLAYGILAIVALGAAIAMYLLRARFAFLDTMLIPASTSLEPKRESAPARRRFAVPLPLACLFVAMMLGGLNYRCLVTALPIYLRGESGAANQEFKLALMVFLALVAGGIGQISGGWASDRFGARRVYPVMLAFLVPFALLLGTLDSSAIAPLVACAVAIFLFAQQPVENSLLAEWTSSRRRSVSYGTKFALTFGVGALGTQVAGLIWYQFDSMAPVFYVIAGSAFLMGLLSWYAARRRALTEQPRVLLEPLPAPAAAIAARAPQELESQMMT